MNENELHKNSGSVDLIQKTVVSIFQIFENIKFSALPHLHQPRAECTSVTGILVFGSNGL